MPTGSDGAAQIVALDAPPNTEQNAAARALFKHHVSMVEIEVFSFCNRRCWFCPNASIDRISSNTLMDPGIYSSILDSLAEINFNGTITYSRYNEPLADRVILERIAEARQKLPSATLHTNTNGDYLDFEYLEALYSAGLRSLNIQIYLRNEERYSHPRIRECAEKMLKRIGVPHHLIKDKPGSRLEYRLTYRDMAISLYGRNFEKDGSNRAALVPIRQTYIRRSPCHMPSWSIYIDYNGQLVPCCNFRSDAPDHADYVIGDLSTGEDIFAIYAGAKATRFRQSVRGWDVKEGLCKHCSFAVQGPLARLYDGVLARLK